MTYESVISGDSVEASEPEVAEDGGSVPSRCPLGEAPSGDLEASVGLPLGLQVGLGLGEAEPNDDPQPLISEATKRGN